MKIIIPRVPKQTTKNELRKVADSLLQRKFRLPFTARPEVTNCEILRITDNRGITDFHGLITVSSEAAADWLIKHIRNESVHSKRLLARRYVERDDQREDFPSLQDRRRKNLEIDKVKEQRVMVEALDQYKKEYRS